MPHDIKEIITRISPGKYDAQRAARFDIERAKGALTSSFPADRVVRLDRESRTVELSLATDQPVEHFFGLLELDVSPSAVILDRVNNGVAPLLVNHEYGLHPGVLVANTVQLGSQVRCTAKFSRSQLGEDMLNDVEDGIRVGTSVGFLVHDMVLVEDKEGELPLYRATKWEILEVSLASVPADPNCGVGRSFEKEILQDPHSAANRALSTTEKTMEETKTPESPAVETVTRSAAEQSADEINRWGTTLGVPELAKRYLTESFAGEKDITVDAFKRFVKENQAASTQVPAPQPEQRSFAPGRVEPRLNVQTIGDAFIRSELYKSTVGKSRQRGLTVAVDVPMTPTALQRATFDSSSTGLQTYIDYQAGPILIEQQRLTVRDLLSVGQTNLSSVPYIQETSYTNAATTVAEEGEKPEASFALQDEFAPVRKIAVIAKVTDEMWNDFPTLRDYINSRLRFMVQEREEAQLLSGAGTGSEITGILTASIQSQAYSASSPTANDHAMAFHNAITKIRVTGKFEPDGMVVHPNDWQQMRLAQDDNKQYYGGGPFSGPYGNGPFASAERYWGLPVVVTTAISEGTGLVGAFKLGAQIWDREGITVDATNSDEDDFRFNRMAIRVEERLALAIYRLNAFCKVTGI